MLKAAGKLAGAAAGIAASGPPTQPQCRAQQSRVTQLQGKEELKREGAPHYVYPEPASEIDKEWLVTDLKQALDEDQVVFGYEEINTTLNSILSFTAKAGKGDTAISSRPSATCVRISELDGTESEDGSETLDSSDANLHMHAAEMQLIAPQAVKEDFTRMLSTLLHNQNVQSACVQALKNDPAFQELLDSPDSVGCAVDIPVHTFLPPAARAANEEAAHDEGGQNGFAELVQRLASGIVSLGEAIVHASGRARDVIGRIFIKMGYNIHALLGQPFGSTPLDEGNPEEANRKAEMVGNALITVACAILTLVLVKRVHRIRFV